ncbi:34041_t:CDS:2 [Racocetra persica]|uniref:34041_t:CDS:1 n=1 Tax=Racocetra persica TaxID=160502 RepID=A0ACA9MHZ7_9GLOM|nr:34041_t:CDS:2 [Racocetra persica]
MISLTGFSDCVYDSNWMFVKTNFDENNIQRSLKQPNSTNSVRALKNLCIGLLNKLEKSTYCLIYLGDTAKAA